VVERTTKLKEISTYVEPNLITQIIRKRGERSQISMSAYLRYLVKEDLKKR